MFIIHNVQLIDIAWGKATNSVTRHLILSQCRKSAYFEVLIQQLCTQPLGTLWHCSSCISR